MTPKKLHDLLTYGTKGFFHDNYWKPVQDLFKRVHAAGMFIQNLNACYEGMERKVWTFELIDETGKGYHVTVCASFAGTVADPMSSYDLCVTHCFSAKIKAA